MNAYARWFGRVVWLGILANLFLALPGLVYPERVLAYFGLEPAVPILWPRFASLLLLLLSLFYIPAASRPEKYRGSAWLTVLARWAGAGFFFTQSPIYWPFALFDLSFGVVQGILLFLSGRSEKWRNRLAWLFLILIIIAVLAYGIWYRFFQKSIGQPFATLREVPEVKVSAEELFKYGSIGIEQTEGIPYWIWLVLPRLFPEKLPGPGGYTALGIVWEEGQELPVGFSKKTIGFPRVAINCAACHTATVRMTPQDKPRIILGGPSHQFDVQGYLRFLFACASDPRFTADYLLNEITSQYDLSWFERLLYRYIIIPGTKKALLRQKEELAWMDERPDWGRGRIDPFNPVKFRILKLPLDNTIGNADMMPLWNLKLRKGLALHWDGLNSSLTEVVLSSAIGDGASKKSIALETLQEIENWLMDLQPPPYPYPIDQTLATRGQEIYAQHCASCHAPGAANTGKIIPIEEIGTDRHRLDMWTLQAAAAYNQFAADYPWGFTHFRKTDGYVAVPHDGLWLRAPYLHNGSVPTLRDLLETPPNRPKVFYRGYDVYDPVNVGFVSQGLEAEREGFLYDTSLPGNDNGGHLYGTMLSVEEKDALIEYLKTL